MTKEQFLLQAKENGVTTEVLLAGLESLLADERKQIHDKYDSVFNETGFVKPDGTQSITHLESTLKLLKSKADKAIEVEKTLTDKITDITNRAPKADEITKTWESKLSELSAKFEDERKMWQAEKINAQISTIGNKFKFQDSLKDAALRVFETEKRDMLANFKTAEHEGSLVLKSGDAIVRNDKGIPITAETYLADKMKVFFAQDDKQQTLPSRPNGSAVVFKTLADKVKYAQEQGIDILTREGQEQIKQLEITE